MTSAFHQSNPKKLTSA